MAFALLPALALIGQTVIAPAVSPAPPLIDPAAVSLPAVDGDVPPTAMIDFLGRRRLCGELPTEADRPAYHRAEWARLACARLPAEEGEWRRLYRADTRVIAWLDRDPQNFQLPFILMSFWDGPPPADVREMEWTGTHAGGGGRFRVRIRTDAENGATTLVTASFDDVPPRTYRIDNARFPEIDLQSVHAAFGEPGPQHELHVGLRYGYRRGYCEQNEADDRPRLSLTFERDRIQAAYQDRINCRTDYRELAP
jgi:hypothetical protein